MESYRELRHKVTANRIETVVFNDTKPNTAFIRNYGSTDLFVSTRSNPSDQNYDQVIPSGAIQSLVKLQPFDRLYMISTGDCSVESTTFENPDIRPADIPETQQIVFINTQPITLGNIERINQPLPVGDNNIGNVDLASAIPTGSNVIGETMDESYTPVKVTLTAGSVASVIKASAGKVASIMTTLTDVLLFDNTTEVYKAVANNPTLVCPIKFNNNITLKSATGGVVYIAYK